MGQGKKFLSALLSCTLACISGLSAVPVNTFAASGNTSVVYDSTNETECKEASVEEPFKVFDIYNAYNGITTETTTAQAVVTSKTTSASTGKTTSATVTTTAKVTTTTSNVTTYPQTTTDTTAEKTEISTTSTTKPSGSLNGGYIRGIDVSEFQVDIDWKKVKASGIDFAIIRAGYGDRAEQYDKKFRQNAQNAPAAGVNTGVYWFSYAMDPEDARLEAQVCIDTIKDFDFNYPIYFDIELEDLWYYSTAYVSQIVDSFCSYVEEQGYRAGIYASGSFMDAKIYEHVRSKYELWVAEYNTAVYSFSGNFGVWQYTDKGWIDGISWPVDLNYGYIDYSKIIEPKSKQEAKCPVNVDAPKEKGIDVSSESGIIEWQKIKDSGYAFAIMRAGSGDDLTKPDTMFKTNLKAANKAGIYRGAYWQAKSTSVEGIKKEAEAFYNIIKDEILEYPVYLDMTDPTFSNPGLSKAQVTELINAFMSYFKNKNYYLAVRGSENFFLNNVNENLPEIYDICLINQTCKPEIKHYFGVWQYDSERVPGVPGIVSVDYSYKGYPSTMSMKGLNGF